jgi:hypothetical protein
MEKGTKFCNQFQPLENQIPPARPFPAIPSSAKITVGIKQDYASWNINI